MKINLDHCLLPSVGCLRDLVNDHVDHSDPLRVHRFAFVEFSTAEEEERRRKNEEERKKKKRQLELLPSKAKKRRRWTISSATESAVVSLFVPVSTVLFSLRARTHAVRQSDLFTAMSVNEQCVHASSNRRKTFRVPTEASYTSGAKQKVYVCVFFVFLTVGNLRLGIVATTQTPGALRITDRTTCNGPETV